MMNTFRKDIHRYLEYLPPNASIFRKIENILFSQGVWAISLFRFGVWISKRKATYLVFIFPYIFLKKVVEILTGINIGTNVQIGEGLYINHFGGIHINSRCVVGKNLFINQDVTIGDSGPKKKFGAPRIGDGVYIGAGAKIIGNIVIGDNVIIGAGAVVVKSVPSNVTVVGVPAKIVARHTNEV